jgi:AcrR family transcriptional regulator
MDATEHATDDATEAALLTAFWEIIARHGWAGVTLRRLAAAAGLTAGQIRALAPGGKEDLLRLHGEHIDRLVAASTVPGQGGTPRDRIFDVIMRRIDAMQPHRAGLLRFLKDLPRRPDLLLALAPGLPASMARLLDAAELSPEGLAGQVRVQGLTLVWLATIRSWAEDSAPDLGKTMAALDRALDRAERVARTLRLAPGDQAAEAALD